MNVLKFFKHHWILTTIILVLIIVRVTLPIVALRIVNNGLKSKSPIYEAHVSDLDLSFLRMAYRFEGIEVRQKASGKAFMTAQAVDVSLAWRDLFRGKITTDIDAQFVDLDFDKSMAMFAADNKEQAKTDAKTVKKDLFPVDIERVTLRQSVMKFRPLAKAQPEESWGLSDIEASATNISSSEDNPGTFFLASATILDNSKMKLAGQAFLKEKPMNWNVDFELHGFDLRAANPITAYYLPLTFQNGTLDMYAEAKSVDGQIKGYARPFAKKLEVVGNQGDFKGVKHFVFEILTSFANWVLESPVNKTMATQIDFRTEGDKFKVDTAKAIKLAIRHGFVEELKQKPLDALDLDNKEGKK